MPLIEGIGDEVTIFFVIVSFFGVLALAWFSTNIRDIPFFSLIIIELSQRRRRQSGQVQQDQNETTNQSNETPVPSAVEFNDDNSSDFTEGSDSNQESSSGDGSLNQADTQHTSDNAGYNSKNTVDKKHCEELGSVESDHDIGDSTTNPKEVVGSSTITNQQEVDRLPIIPQSADSDLSETELRRRRVAFFENKTVVDNEDATEKRTDDSSFHGVPLEKGESTTTQESNVSLPQEDECLQSDVSTSSPKVNQLSESCGISNDHSNNESTAHVHEQATGTSTHSADDSDESQIRIRLKYLNDSQRQVTALPTQTVGQFRRNNFASELENNKLVRFIFNGQDLRNDANTLQAYNIVDNSVVHCLITQVDRQTNHPHGQEADDGFDIGNFMLPVFGFIICVIWYFRFEYRQFFSGTATVSLIGVTFLYIAAILASWENHRRGHAHEHVD